jgi:CII-binding regulator of phage lambda lysogenization HflD
LIEFVKKQNAHSKQLETLLKKIQAQHKQEVRSHIHSSILSCATISLRSQSQKEDGDQLRKKVSELEQTLAGTAEADRQQLSELQRLFRETETELRSVTQQHDGMLFIYPHASDC